MTTFAEPVAEQTREQALDVSLVLRPGLAPVAQAVSRYPESSPLVAVEVMRGLTFITEDPDALRDLADALLTAAAELHAARDEWREANGL